MFANTMLKAVCYRTFCLFSDVSSGTKSCLQTPCSKQFATGPFVYFQMFRKEPNHVCKYHVESSLLPDLLSIFRRFVRNQIMFANTMFKAVCYRPNESQIITAGTDRKVRVQDNFQKLYLVRLLQSILERFIIAFSNQTGFCKR